VISKETWPNLTRTHFWKICLGYFVMGMLDIPSTERKASGHVSFLGCREALAVTEDDLVGVSFLLTRHPKLRVQGHGPM